MENKLKLILASSSPRRQELIKGCFLNFKIDVADIDEDIQGMSPRDLVSYLAFEKAKTVLNKREDENELILGADTIVVLDDKILGKPKSKEEARNMLKSLSGRSHEVLTGFSLVTSEESKTFVESTKVYFKEISDDLLELYLNTGESMDKAGSYGIQGVALSFIEKVEGSYSNVVGLPVDRVLEEIKSFVKSENDNTGRWREKFE